MWDGSNMNTTLRLHSRHHVGPVDARVFGGFLHSFLRHADCVKIANLAQIVTGKDPKAANSYENPSAVCARSFGGLAVRNGKAYGQLPPLAFVAMTLNLR